MHPWGSRSALRDAEQFLHEGGGEGVYVVDAQQPLGVLGIDAAKLGEHSHDLQEQEPAGQPEQRLGGSPPSPLPTILGTTLELHTFGGCDLRTLRVNQNSTEKVKVEFLKHLFQLVDKDRTAWGT